MKKNEIFCHCNKHNYFVKNYKNIANKYLSTCYVNYVQVIVFIILTSLFYMIYFILVKFKKKKVKQILFLSKYNCTFFFGNVIDNIIYKAKGEE